MPFDLAALGAFLSGVSAVIASMWALRAVRRRDERDCERRIKELREALLEGIEVGRKDR